LAEEVPQEQIEISISRCGIIFLMRPFLIWVKPISCSWRSGGYQPFVQNMDYRQKYSETGGAVDEIVHL